MALSLSAETFILKSGKIIQGTIRYEEPEVLRIVDSSGVFMNLRKSSLDYEAMKRVNVRKDTYVPHQEPATVQPARPLAQPSVVYTNSNISVPTGDRKTRLRKAEVEFNKLKAACRAAGQSSPSSVVWNSTTYMVHGKPVTVTGYWAHPDNVAKAKRICQNAIRAEEELKEIKQAGNGSTISAGTP